LCSFYQDDSDAPVDDPLVHHTVYDDGTIVEYDSGAHVLRVATQGTVDVVCGELAATVSGEASLICDSLTATCAGNVSLSAVGNVAASALGSIAVTAAQAATVTSALGITLTAPQIVCAGLLVPMMGMAPPVPAPGMPAVLEIQGNVKVLGKSETTGELIGASLSVSGEVSAATIGATGSVSASDVVIDGVSHKSHRHNVIAIGAPTGGPTS
jgi:phage baseplate assembly protein gpV